MNGLRVERGFTIPESELQLRFSTSGGPGGQHANRSSTKVTLVWNVDSSEAVGARRRSIIKRKLRHRIASSGDISVSADEHRSQLMNRREAERRLATLLANSLKPDKVRRATAPSLAAKNARIQAKKRRGEIKRLRREKIDRDQ